MVKFSPGASMAWAFAFAEIDLTGHEIIEKEDVLYGICNLEVTDIPVDWIPDEIRGLITDESLERIKNESLTIKSIFRELYIDLLVFREVIRSEPLEGPGYRPLQKNEMSFECRSCFDRAKNIAEEQGSSEATSLHLLTAIIEEIILNPEQEVYKKLENYDIVSIKQLAYVKMAKEREISEKNSHPIYDPYYNDYNTPILNSYGTDLTKMAREGKLDPLIGRDEELLQLIRTLSRKKKNNPLIIGEAGVGKTALIRGLAQKIAQSNVPDKLINKRIVEIDMGNIVAGTRYRGEFEEKLTQILHELKENPSVILFIDEIHTVIGAGSCEGSNLDASDIMKPALAQGDICCIGATTLSEFRKYFERDSAMERRFQPIMVEEPSPEDTASIMKSLKGEYERHHDLRISDPVIENVVKLSVRYIHDRNLPDKAMDLLDEACSRKKIRNLDSFQHMNSFEVTTEDIAMVLEELLGIPIKIGEEEKKTLLNLENILKKKVVGQDEAVEALSKRIRIARSGLQDPGRPYGVFLFLGPTGVGKTELAKNLARVLFGSESAMIRLDMSELMNDNSISKLIGAPPGYIGYGDEGQLTGALRTQPYSVVLLDEIEKAHPKVFDIFLQVFDDGIITDSQGRTVDAKNAIFIMTSNLTVSEDTGFEAAYGIHEQKTGEEYKINTDILKSFKPEFINRINEILIFNPLNLPELMKITRIMMEELKEKLEAKKIHLEVDEAVIKYIARNGFDPDFGARPLKRVIERVLEDPLSEKIIKGEIDKLDTVKIEIKNRDIYISNSKPHNTGALSYYY